MRREIVLDTETTGLNPHDGHRITEIGCVELIDYVPTGKTYHTYVNPEREVPEVAEKITGLTYAFLKDFPLFKDICQNFLDFIGDAPLVIHNAAFDMRFINSELERQFIKPIAFSRAIDTIQIARAQFPGSPANLDALCKRFDIDLSKREKHGALLDAELLARVYLELRGGRQKDLFIQDAEQLVASYSRINRVKNWPERDFRPSAEEARLHQEFLKKFKAPIWNATKQ